MESELTDFNNLFIHSIKTKNPFWGGFGRIMAADAIGAGLGLRFAAEPHAAAGIALVSGVYSSLSCLIAILASNDTQVTDEGIIGHNFFDSEAIVYDNCTSIDQYDSIGIIHNRVISAILNETSNISSLSGSELVQVVIDALIDDGQEVVFTPDECIYEIDSISHLATTEAMFEALATNHPSATEELNIIELYTETIPNIQDEDITDYSIGFKEIVENSEISAESKKMIKTTISVAGNSTVLWNEELLN